MRRTLVVLGLLAARVAAGEGGVATPEAPPATLDCAAVTVGFVPGAARRGTLDSDPDTWRALALAVKDPRHPLHETAVLELMEEVHVVAERMLRRTHRYQEDREDLAQEAAVSVLAAMGSYDGVRPPGPFIREIIHRRSVDHVRREVRVIGAHGRGESGVEESGPELAARAPREADDASPLASIRDHVNGALATLERESRSRTGTQSAQERSALEYGVIRTYLQGMPVAAIAARHHVDAQTVSNIVFKHRSRWVRELVERGVVPEDAAGALRDTIVDVHRNEAAAQNARLPEAQRRLLESLFLDGRPAQSSYDVLVALGTLPEIQADALRLVAAGKTHAEIARTLAISTERARALVAEASAAVDRALAAGPERTWAEREILPAVTGATYASYHAAMGRLAEEHRVILRRRAQGGSDAELARELGLPGAAAAALRFRLAHAALLMEMGGAPGDGWIRSRFLRRFPNRSLEELMRAIDTLPPATRDVLRLRAVGHSPEEIATQLGQPLETVRTHLRVGSESVERRLSTVVAVRPPSEQDWLDEWVLNRHPGATTEELWSAAEAVLDTQRLAVVRARHQGKSTEEIAQELQLRDERHVRDLLTSAQSALHGELGRRRHAGAVNPYAEGTPDHWAWSFLLYQYPDVPAERFWAVAEEALSVDQLAVVRGLARGASWAEVGRSMNLEAEHVRQRMGQLLTQARAKMNRRLAPRQESPFVRDTLASVPGSTEEELWRAVEGLSEQHRTVARLRADGASDADIGAVVQMEPSKVPSFVYSMKAMIVRRLKELHPAPASEESTERWVREWFLDRYPGRTLPEFWTAVATLENPQMARALRLRADGRSVAGTAQELGVSNRDVTRLLDGARRALARRFEAGGGS